MASSLVLVRLLFDTFGRRLAALWRPVLPLMLLALGTPALAQLAQPTDNNLHIDRGVSYTNVVFLGTSGGTSPYAFTFPGALPAGITVTSDGLLSGVTCASNGTYPLGLVTVTDAASQTNSKTGLTLIVNAAPAGGCSLTITSSTSTGTVGTPISGSVTASGGSSPYTYSIAAGSLPPGVTLDTNTGALSGTPTTAGSYTFSVMAADASTSSGAQSFTFTIAAAGSISLSPSSLPGGYAALGYSQTLTASGGTAPYAFSLSAGSLPPGLTLSSGGVLSGTPTTAGSYSFTVQAQDSVPPAATQSYTVVIGAALTTSQAVPSTTLVAGSAATAFTPVTASGGSGSYTFAVSPGLPGGLSFNTGTGQITGTPGASSGTATHTVTVTDGTGASSSKTFSLTVNAALATTQAVASTTLTAGQAATPFTPVTASGGSGSYTVAVSPGLPAGLSFNTGNGQITGTASGASGSSTYTVTVTDGTGASSSKTFSLTVSGALSTTQVVATSTLTTGVAVTPFTPVTASGGTGPISFSLAPALPAGLSFNTTTGQITGTPTAAAASGSYTVLVTDANGATSSKIFTLGVNSPAPIVVAPPSLPGGMVGEVFAQNVVASGGVGPYTLALSGGALPAGLSLSSSGLISGQPSVAGTFNFTITATDSLSATSSRSYAVNILAGLATDLVTPNVTLTAGTGVQGVAPVAATGGTAPYAFAVAPALPAGLTLDPATGRLSGTASTPFGPGTFNVTVTDGRGQVSTRSFVLEVKPSLDATAQVEQAQVKLNQAMAAFTPVVPVGGTGPFKFTISPSLPAGLTLDPATGQVSGKPTAELPPTSYEVTVVDANGATARRSFRLSVSLPVSIDVQPRQLQVPQAGLPFQVAFNAAGGTAPYRYQGVAGALPEGLVLSADGRISGRARRAGNGSFTLRITDAAGNTADIAVAWTVGARPDPLADATLAGLQAAQADALRRMASAQMRNIDERLEGDLECLPDFRQQLHLNAPWQDQRSQAEKTATSAGGAPARACERGWTGWVAGTVDYGRVRGDTERAERRFSSPGLTVGADMAPLPGLRVGLAWGRGQDRTLVSQGQGRLDVRADSVSAYAAWRLASGLRMSLVAGQSRATLDLQRLATGDTAQLAGSRDATQRFAALGLTARTQLGGWQLTPRASMSLQHTTLRSYTETGDSPLALAFDRATLRSTDWRGGAVASTSWPLGALSLQPQISLDWHRVLDGGTSQVMRYADDPEGPSYQRRTGSSGSHFGELGLALRLRHPSGVALSVGGRTLLGASGSSGQGYSASFTLPF